MPLIDRQDFQTWLDHTTQGQDPRTPDDPARCGSCDNALDHGLNSHECLVCLAERFGTETAENWIAEALAGFIRAAADPDVLARMLAELIPHAHDIADLHAPPPPTTA